jgi:hypothetical protein
VVTRAARRGVRCCAGLKVTDSDHLVPRPNSDGEGAGAAAQDRVGAVVEWLTGWNHGAPTDPDEGGGEQLGWQLAGQLDARMSLGKEGAETYKVLEKNFDNSVN